VTAGRDRQLFKYGVNMKIKDDELIERLRAVLNLEEIDITDDQLLQATEGSFLRARIQLGIELEHFKELLRST